MASFNIDEQTADSLRARATAEGLSVQQFLQQLLALSPAEAESSDTTLTVEELDQLLDAETTSSPGLPADFCRADIYLDHD